MRVFALDMPGHGFSSHSLVSYYDAFNDGFLSIHRAIRHFGWEKVTLLGHSFGSELCYVFAGVYPDMTDRYIAIGNLEPAVLDPVKTIRRATISLFEYEKKITTTGLSQQSYSYEELLHGFCIARSDVFGLSIPACETLLQRGALKQSDGNFIYSHDFKIAIPFGFEKFSYEHIQEIASALTRHTHSWGLIN